MKRLLLEEVQSALVDKLAFLQTPPRVLLFPAAQHELLVGLVALRSIVMGRRFKHRGADLDLGKGTMGESTQLCDWDITSPTSPHTGQNRENTKVAAQTVP